jgi:formylglycine-generating enzyme required for sulfatase activity
LNFTPTPGIGSSWTRPADGMVMAFVPQGDFEMGSNTYDDEKPIHTVTLDSYWMDSTEVTNAMYEKCVNAGACEPPKSTGHYSDAKYENHPVVYVDWSMANTYCEWADAHLPTEAEWEKAARGTDGRTYPWGEGLDCNKANCYGCVRDTTAVGSYASGKSPYGLFDMAGNVWEWVMDWHDSNYYASSPSSNPQGPVSGQYRVLRGGSWSVLDNVTRSSNRNWNTPVNADDLIGFRCARSLP